MHIRGSQIGETRRYFIENVAKSHSFNYICKNLSNMSYVSAFYHVVINTHYRGPNLNLNCIDELYKYIVGIASNYNSRIIRINGTNNHIHILLDLHPSIALSSLVREIKRSSSMWMKGNSNFAKFGGWGREYFAFSCSSREIEAVKHYIENQRSHHGFVSFEDELCRIVERNGGNWSDYLLT